MKKKGFKKALAIVMVAAMCLALPGIGTYAQELPENIGIAPANIIISATENLLEWVGTNTLEIYGGTQVPPNYDAYVKVELQQKNGTSWTTIKTWTDRYEAYAMVSRNYAVTSGYQYRLKLTHKAYDSNGNLIETITKYSDIV